MGDASDPRQFAGLKTADTTLVGEEQNPAAREVGEKVANNATLLQVHTAHAFAITTLCLIGIDLGAFGVARGGNGCNHAFAGDEVLLGDVAFSGRDLGATAVTILFHDLTQLLLDDGVLTIRVSQDALQIGDLELGLNQLADNFLAFQSSQATQLHH